MPTMGWAAHKITDLIWSFRTRLHGIHITSSHTCLAETGEGLQCRQYRTENQLPLVRQQDHYFPPRIIWPPVKSRSTTTQHYTTQHNTTLQHKLPTIPDKHINPDTVSVTVICGSNLRETQCLSLNQSHESREFSSSAGDNIQHNFLNLWQPQQRNNELHILNVEEGMERDT